MLAVIVGAQRIDHRLPGALVGLILSIVAVDALGLASHHWVAVLGAVQGGSAAASTCPPPPGRSCASCSPRCSRWPSSASPRPRPPSGRRAPRSPAATDFNRDLIGVGAGSVAAGLIGAFAVDASPPNTAIVTASGARSQLTNVMAAVVVLVVVVVATAPLPHLPQATLGATLVFIATKLFRVGELRTILRFDRLEFALAAATLLVVALVGIEQGVALAMILSLADRTRRSARPRDGSSAVSLAPTTGSPIDIGLPTEYVPGSSCTWSTPLCGTATPTTSRAVRSLVDQPRVRCRR